MVLAVIFIFFLGWKLLSLCFNGLCAIPWQLTIFLACLYLRDVADGIYVTLIEWFAIAVLISFIWKFLRSGYTFLRDFFKTLNKQLNNNTNI